MRRFSVLARVQLRALLASVWTGRSRRRAASGWAATALIAGLCLYVSGIYSFSLGGQLAAAGCLELLLLTMSAMAAVAGLAFTAFAAQGVVFGGRDTDLLLSMPVSAFTVMLAKLTALYAENLLLCAFLMLPAGAAWLWFGGEGGVLFAVRLVIGVPFLAMTPTALSLAAGFALSWLGGRFANRRAVNLLLYGLLAAAVFFLALRFNAGVSAAAAGAAGADSAGAFSVWGAPFLLFQRGVCGDWETLAMFCLLSLAPVLLAVRLFSGSYRRVLTGLDSCGRRPAYRLGRLEAAGQGRALLRKEAGRYFGTPVYLFNTGIGLIMLVIAGAAAVAAGGGLREQLALAGLGELPLAALPAAAVGFLLSTVTIAASSVSLEGEGLWIIKEAPVSAGRALDAKAAFQLLLSCPCALICSGGLAWGLGLTPGEGAALAVFAAAFAAFTALLGLTVNLLFPKLDAVSDVAVVKQSAAVALSLLGGMSAALGCGALVWALSGPVGGAAALAACAAVLLAACGALLGWLHTGGARRFAQL